MKKKSFKFKPLFVYLSENSRLLRGLNKKSIACSMEIQQIAWITKATRFKYHFCTEVKKIFATQKLKQQSVD